MNPLLHQFLRETRDLPDEIARQLRQLEDARDDTELLAGLIGLLHTLKQNSVRIEFGALARSVQTAVAASPAARPDVGAASLSALDQTLMLDLLTTQRRLMDLPFHPGHWAGRLASVCITLHNLYLHRDPGAAQAELAQAIEAAQTSRSFAPLAVLLDQQLTAQPPP